MGAAKQAKTWGMGHGALFDVIAESNARAASRSILSWYHFTDKNPTPGQKAGARNLCDLF
jgi:hypothetical protein